MPSLARDEDQQHAIIQHINQPDRPCRNAHPHKPLCKQGNEQRQRE